MRGSYRELLHPRDRRGRWMDAPPRAPQSPPRYKPDPDAPEEGEFVWDGDVAVGWRQAHDVLVREALHRWKGWPSDAQLQMDAERRGDPIPGSGSGKKLRAEGAALLWELEHRAHANDVALYRGQSGDAHGASAWTENRTVAEHWAKLGGGRVETLAPGQAHGIRIADYIGSGLDELEQEWVVLPKVAEAEAEAEATQREWWQITEGKYDESLHPRGRGGKWVKAFHVAPRSLRSSIREHGLDYRRNPAPKPYQQNDPAYRPGNYLFTDRSEAEGMAKFAQDLTGEPHDVWQVETEGGTHPDLHTGEFQSSVRVTDAVPPENVRLKSGEPDAPPRITGPEAGDEPLPGGGDFYVGGGCVQLAIAFQQLNPKLKIAVDWYDDHGDLSISHAIAYDPDTGEGYDGFGVHSDYREAFRAYDDKSSPSVKVDEDADAQEIADHMRSTFGPADLKREPWANDAIYAAGAWASHTFQIPGIDPFGWPEDDVEEAKSPQLDAMLASTVKLRDGSKPDGWRYGNMDELVLAEGRSWEPQPLPPEDEPWRGDPKLCFKNAADAVLGMGGKPAHPGWRYVEGYVLPRGVPLPILHAWAVDENDRVIELTLPEPGVEYRGIVFTDDELRAALLRRERYGVLDDMENEWPLLRHGLAEAKYDERLHPRGRLGQWVRSLGFPTYAVGGSVRDKLLGRDAKDEDFMVVASPEKIRAAVEEQGGTADDLTVRDRLVGVRVTSSGTGTGLIPPGGVEIAPPRVEVSTGPGRHDFDIVPHPAVAEPWGPRGDVAEPRDRMFHVAPKAYREAILRDGLKAGGDPEVDSEPGVFMVPQHPAESVNPDFTNPETDDVWEIDTRGLEIRHDLWGEHLDEPYLGDLGGSFYFAGSVPPDRLHLRNDPTETVELPAIPPGSVGDPLHDDAFRRDFTANALYQDVSTGEIIDPTGRGKTDVESRVLHVISEDSFRDDPLRILRGLRFQSQLGLEPDEETLAQMREHADAVTALTQKGVSGTARTEIDKMLMGDHVGDALRTMRDTGVLAAFLPELAPTIGFDQESKYHSLPLDEHIIRVVEEAARMGAPLEVRLAALFHDAGKPESAWRGKDGRLHYYAHDGHEDHAVVGARLARDALTRLAYPRAVVDDVVKLVENHMLAPSARPKKVRELRARMGDRLLDMLFQLRRADMAGKGEDDDGSRASVEFTAEDRAEFDAISARTLSEDPDAWCDAAAQAVADYLERKGVEARIGSDGDSGGGFDGMTHSWTVVPDGTIIDAAVEQFAATGGGWPGTSHVAIVPPGHPYAKHYDDRVNAERAPQPDDAQAELDAMYERVKQSREAGDPLSIRDLAIDGADLIDAGYKPGPGLGDALKALLNDVLADPSLNTPEWLLAQARRRLRKLV